MNRHEIRLSETVIRLGSLVRVKALSELIGLETVKVPYHALGRHLDMSEVMEVEIPSNLIRDSDPLKFWRPDLTNSHLMALPIFNEISKIGKTVIESLEYDTIGPRSIVRDPNQGIEVFCSSGAWPSHNLLALELLLTF